MWKEELDVEFDVFLSHKAIDAAEHCLVLYKVLSARGYVPFLDRICLDDVESIPKYVAASRTIVMVLTSAYFDSYWCMREVIAAVELHAQERIQILLMTMSCQSWIAADGRRAFPQREHVFKHYGKWFPNLERSTCTHIEALFGGDEYTSARRLVHSRLFLRVFERRLIARCGPSMQTRKMLKQIILVGGQTVKDKAALAVQLVAEANDLHARLGDPSVFEAQVGEALGGVNSQRCGEEETQGLSIARGVGWRRRRVVSIARVLGLGPVATPHI